jgi:hypothetical protein
MRALVSSATKHTFQLIGHVLYEFTASAAVAAPALAPKNGDMDGQDGANPRDTATAGKHRSMSGSMSAGLAMMRRTLSRNGRRGSCSGSGSGCALPVAGEAAKGESDGDDEISANRPVDVYVDGDDDGDENHTDKNEDEDEGENQGQSEVPLAAGQLTHVYPMAGVCVSEPTLETDGWR